MTKKLRLFIVDDHSLFREGLKFLLSGSDFVEEVFEAANGKRFVEQVLTVMPDIILMDIEMPEMNGIDATRECMQHLPGAKIIALSMYGNENYYTEMIDAGAKGFLLKNSKFVDVEKAIKEVYKGNNYFSPEILDSIIKNMNKKGVDKKNTDLTEREIEVLFNICKGLSNQEIANHLSISKRTVDKHRENVLLKTNSKNTAELVVYAIKYKFFEV